MDKYPNVEITVTYSTSKYSESNNDDVNEYTYTDIGLEKRLLRVLGYIEGRLAACNINLFYVSSSVIKAMHDRNDDLYILWDRKPNDLEKSIAGYAWKMYAGHDNVSHYEIKGAIKGTGIGAYYRKIPNPKTPPYTK
jgi:hypothetical protein